MGVPGFFAWLLKRYKNIIMKDIDEDISILYLDANCLIHPQCFKILELYQNIKNVQELEDKMIDRVIKYIDYLINHVSPTDEVYISVDGVAPLAKMNQQRKRRFRSDNDRSLVANIKKKHGVIVNENWSNTAITPGTEFMEKLNQSIIKYINNKTINITYSSYHTPGEGEHKILDDIRLKVNDVYYKNKNFVIYGLDADLIFLSLSSQKEGIYLLRESQHLNKNNKSDKHISKNDTEKNGTEKNDISEDLDYVSIDKTKECINTQIIKIMNSKYNRILLENGDINLNLDLDFSNDFIFICYLLGNDFLPHLPSVHIRTGGLDFLLDCYSDIFMSNMDNKLLINLTDNNVFINNDFLKNLFSKISDFEDYYFKIRLPKHKDIILKRQCSSSNELEKELWMLNNMRNIDIVDPIKLGEDGRDLWKFRYYEHYFGSSEDQDILISEISSEYLRGIMWITKYYFKGCPSWNWQYNHHHAPFVSDINFNININDIKFEKSTPVTPFIQLLSVLPPSCNHLLPKNYSNLMTSKTSPIIDLYPINITLDMINKHMFHECCTNIPCVNISRIIECINIFKNTNKNTNNDNTRDCLLENYKNY